MQLTDTFLVIRDGVRSAENPRHALQCLVLPGRDLGGMHLMVRGNLGNGLLASDRLQGDLRLEFRRMVTSWPSHGIPSGNARTEFHLYSCPKSRSHLSAHSLRDGGIWPGLRCLKGWV